MSNDTTLFKPLDNNQTKDLKSGPIEPNEIIYGLHYFEGPAATLVLNMGTPEELRFPFGNYLEIGRYKPDASETSKSGTSAKDGQMQINDSKISSRHCILTRGQDGRCFVRDVSRNGTRIDNRRLVPSVETEVFSGQTLCLSERFKFHLIVEASQPNMANMSTDNKTVVNVQLNNVSILVGDIRDYTVLVRKVPELELNNSVRRVFAQLEKKVTEYQGTVKEYQGDAIFSFWEEQPNGENAIQACRAALALNKRAIELGKDKSIWDITDFPLKMEWAVTTGPVFIDTYGEENPTGLSMIGQSVVLAFRLEKFANDETGPVLTCPVTYELAKSKFRFRDLGQMQAKGFEGPDQVYALDP